MSRRNLTAYGPLLLLYNTNSPCSVVSNCVPSAVRMWGSLYEWHCRPVMLYSASETTILKDNLDNIIAFYLSDVFIFFSRLDIKKVIVWGKNCTKNSWTKLISSKERQDGHQHTFRYLYIYIYIKLYLLNIVNPLSTVFVCLWKP